MNKYPDKVISLRFDEVDCYICKSRGIRQKILLKYYSYIHDYEIADTWYFCKSCGKKHYQYFRAKTTKILNKAEFN